MEYPLLFWRKIQILLPLYKWSVSVVNWWHKFPYLVKNRRKKLTCSSENATNLWLRTNFFSNNVQSKHPTRTMYEVRFLERITAPDLSSRRSFNLLFIKISDENVFKILSNYKFLLLKNISTKGLITARSYSSICRYSWLSACPEDSLFDI